MAQAEPHPVPEQHHADLAHAVMRRQAALSIRVAAVFLAMLFGLPLVNYLLPELANLPVFGFTATWLFLGVLFYPLTWLLSWYFIRESDRIEASCADWRGVLGIEAGEPLEPAGIDEIHPAFIETDMPSSPFAAPAAGEADPSESSTDPPTEAAPPQYEDESTKSGEGV